ncbi:uncharacterized protein UDID_06982 [Ustilago sp. UG-2017a]|nr:uncharacterized protein UDID_06982 [Ustilago sp. UG-2017a]
MRDQHCQCGCGLNAASSSRSSYSPVSSTRTPSRAQVAMTRSGIAQQPSLSPMAIQSSVDDEQGALSSPHDITLAGGVQLCSVIARKQRPRSSLLLFPFIALMLLTLISTVASSSIPAVTFLPQNSNSSAPSQTTYTALPTTALPTTAPAPAAGVDSHKQLAAVGSNSASGTPNHNVNVEISQPVMCEYMNITFDPSRGTPPYTVMISIEDYWPVTVNLPANYDHATKDLWLYQYPVPTFTGDTTNPSLIVSVTDSTGLMSNSSSFLQVSNPNSGATCPPFQYDATWFFYTERAASMCQDYNIFWNGSWAPPVTAIFLPEQAPPIYVPAPANVYSNMSWKVAMEGGTRFIMTLGDSRAVGGNAGSSRLNIVALNEYFSNACIAEANYEHRLFLPTTTASPATIFPDATSTIASLTTNGGIVATVTVIETIKAGRYVHGKNGGPLSSGKYLILMVVILVTVGLAGMALGWLCFRRHQKRKHNIKAWDLPNNDPSTPFSADPNMPIAPGVFGRSVTRHDSTSASSRGGPDRNSVSGVSNYDPTSLTCRPLTHAPSTRGSLRSWTSSAFEPWGGQAGDPLSAADNYALMSTASGGLPGVSPSEAHRYSYGLRGGSNNHARSMTMGTFSNESRDGLSPTDSNPRNFGFYSDDPPHHRNGAPPAPSRAVSSDGASTKSNRVGPGPTYRPDAASQAAYQDLLSSNASPTSGVDRSFPFSPARSQAATPRGNGWAEISDNNTHGNNGSQPRVVQHADAGLLLDDNDNGDELINFGTGRLMELPPQYDTIHPSSGTGTQQRPLYAQSPSSTRNEGSTNSQSLASQHRQHTHGTMASVDISDARNRPAEVHAADLVDPNDDESDFWAH